MNPKLLLKALFLLVMLFLLGLMFMNNKQDVKLSMPRVPTVSQPAAIMYFGFFAVGFLTGTILMAGRKGGGGGSGGSK